MDAVLIAGGIPQPGEPLYEYTRGRCKALLDIAGKPMIQWILDALDESKTVERVVLVGLESDHSISLKKPLVPVPNYGSLLENVRAGIKKVLEISPSTHRILVVSSDIPTVTGEMIDWVVHASQQTEHDVYYSVISRQVMEARFPGSRRSYTRLKDMELCGADMNVVRAMTVTENEQLWERLISARKNVFKQAGLIGYDTLILLLLKWISLDGAVKRASRRLGVRGRAIVSPYAEIGMDVDKPHQLELVRADLARRVSA